MDSIVTTTSNVMHGTPCFAGTRVAVRTLLDHLEAGYTIDGFLAEFPTVKREQVTGVLEKLHNQLAKMADEALAEFEAGETLPMDLDRDFPQD
jgi:uncharacterized protein (DUF433 family)